MAVAEISAMLIGDIERMAGELFEASPNLPLADLQRLAHTLKSSAAQLGGREFSAVAREIEFAVRDGRPETLPVLRMKLREALDRLKIALQA